MNRLFYVAMTSLDGYIEDRDGGFGWAEPDDEVHAFVTELVRPVHTHLYGRRLYETMAAWETDGALAAESEVMRDFAAVWRRAEKVVFSTTLHDVVTTRTRVVPRFDPAQIHVLKSSTEGDLTVGGAELAAHAIRAGLVDELHLLVAPVVVGGGKPALPGGTREELELLDERRFRSSGVVYLRYLIRT